jgi:hypothetical protein
MRYGTKSSFDRAYKKLTPVQQDAVDDAIDLLCDLHEGVIRIPPAGLGLKSFGKYLEIRAGLGIRIFFRWEGPLTLFFVGNHNEVKRFAANG